MKLFYRFWHTLFRVIFKVLYRHRVIGIENIPKGAAILASNHISYWDPPLVGTSCPQEIHYLARGSLFEQFGLGWIICNLNSHPVKGNAGDLKSIKMVCKLLREGQKVMIFPEGIRSWDGKLLPIKPGVSMIAQREHAPIVPVYLDGVFQVWPRTRRFPRLWGRTTCVFGKPIYPENYNHLTKRDAQLAIAKTLEESLQELQDSCAKLS